MLLPLTFNTQFETKKRETILIQAISRNERLLLKWDFVPSRFIHHITAFCFRVIKMRANLHILLLAWMFSFHSFLPLRFQSILFGLCTPIEFVVDVVILLFVLKWLEPKYHSTMQFISRVHDSNNAIPISCTRY